ncbi:MAG: hypothetical protein A2017_04240 [Lentisphaerae bacterium GWF2_44_16]|nr:MAG: hypothetical protein A2017_04240 [Lentisphaerae bacterium GWF2_44_16]
MARIIVADDSRMALAFYSHVLDYMGHEVALCENGKEVVEEFRKKPADLLILDVEMPEMDGNEACSRIRKMPEGINIPIIIVSAHDDEQDILKGLNAGANDYLLKPVKEAHLIAKLKTFLYTSSLHKKDIDLAKNHTELAGRYRIEKLIGYGSHSVVFMAKDLKNDNFTLAVKLLNEKFISENISKPFIETAEKIKNIDCPNVLKIFEYGQYNSQLYVVLEYADGGDLKTLLKKRKLSELEAAKLAFDIVKGLKAFSEKNIVHLDIKPENIMLHAGGYKVGDFGITIPRENSTLPINAEIWSTAAYLPPEALTGESAVDSRSDIYSLGITLYEALSGDNPFQSEKPTVAMFRQINFNPPQLKDFDGSVSSPFSDIISLMINKAPDERPSLKELEYTFPQLIEFIEYKELETEKKKEEKVEKELEEKPVNEEYIAEKIISEEEKRVSDEIKKIRKRIYRAQKRKNTPFIQSILTILIFAALILLFANIGYYIFGFIAGPYKQEIIRGSEAMIMCVKCGKIDEQRVIDIHSNKCAKCGGKVGFAMVCEDCKKDFPFTEPEIKADNIEEYTRKYDELNKCPFCSSKNIKPMLTEKERRRTLKK